MEDVYVNDPTDCDLTLPSVTLDPQAQCIKCADLAVTQSVEEIRTTGGGPPVTSFPEKEASTDLIATPNNVFTICQADGDDAQKAAFNTQVDIINDDQETLIQNAFSTCLIMHLTHQNQDYKHKPHPYRILL